MIEKSIGELIDMLSIENVRIWHSMEKMKTDPGDAENVQAHLAAVARRTKLISAINEKYGEEELPKKTYGEKLGED